MFTFLFSSHFQGINISELEGESYDNRKRKSAEEAPIDCEDKPSSKKSKKQNDAKVEKNFPGRFVLLKPPQSDQSEKSDEEIEEHEDEIFNKPEATAIRTVS